MDSITDMLSQGRDAQAQASKIYGVVIGIVTNNQDPDKLGRVKVKFPWLADDVESWWARPAYPMNGKLRGHWWIPEIDDEVLIAFEHGDPNRPYLLGGLYNGVDTPPIVSDITETFSNTSPQKITMTSLELMGNDPRELQKDGKNDLRFIRSRSGHLFIFDDKENDERIVLCDKTGKHRLEISTNKKLVKISSADADGDIELIADRKISLLCKELYTESLEKTEMWAGTTFSAESQDDMKHKSGANMSREAASNIDEKAGSNISYKAGAAFDAKSGAAFGINAGSTLAIQASATAEIKSGAPMTIKGATVAIN